MDIPDFIWRWFSANEALIVPIALPLGFFAADAILKLILGQREFQTLGADLALCGCSLFIGTMLAEILLGHIAAPDETVTCFVFAAVFLIVWFGCLGLDLRAAAVSIWFSILALLLGGGIFYLSAVFFLAYSAA